ncbi:MAG: acyl-CoA dehydratase activase-related protein [Coriobacteriia bacterium]|nr:acyl-CoA dehydratase activase-related protein [Coriobacteriia bacterium]MCL2537003.1 acyl-CoA dehydratase activase-related protein [Coriobacteriia bacterium]
MKIGIPRALLFYFYEDLWLGFFDNLGIETIVSPPSNSAIAKAGIAHSIDEACYSSKLFIGHVQWLLDSCDMVFVPRYADSGIREEYCTRIFGLYDLVRNTFPEAKVLHAEVSFLHRKKESEAFVQIGEALGFTREESLKAYKDAAATAQARKGERIAAQEELLKADGMKILLASHAYNSYDAVIGAEIIDYFERNEVKVIHSDLINTREAKKRAKDSYSDRIYWRVSSDMIGGIDKYKDQADGIVMISTFPCGPDSLFAELVIRLVKDVPVLSLVIDEHDATAGIQTRLESFIDIIEAKKKAKSLLEVEVAA